MKTIKKMSHFLKHDMYSLNSIKFLTLNDLHFFRINEGKTLFGESGVKHCLPNLTSI